MWFPCVRVRLAAGSTKPNLFSQEQECFRWSVAGDIGKYKHYLFFFCLFLTFRAMLVAYGGSQARGPIRAIVAGLQPQQLGI